MLNQSRANFVELEYAKGSTSWVCARRRMRDLNPRDFRLRVFETRALGRYANPPVEEYFDYFEWAQ